MPRVAFRLRLRPGTVDEYEKAHQQVWPELLAKMKEVGISDYSIFRRELDLFLVMQVADFDRAWDTLANDPTNLRWQKEMARFFDRITNLAPGERFAMMKEVFHMD